MIIGEIEAGQGIHTYIYIYIYCPGLIVDLWGHISLVCGRRRVSEATTGAGA